MVSVRNHAAPSRYKLIFIASRCKASSIGLTYALATTYRHPESVFAARTGSWIIALYVTTLVTNLTATGELTFQFGFCFFDRAGVVLLAARLWTVDHSVKAPKAESDLRIVFRVVVESGVIYTVISVISLVAFIVDSPAVYIIRDLVRAYYVSYFNPSSHMRGHTEFTYCFHRLQHDLRTSRLHDEPRAHCTWNQRE